MFGFPPQTVLYGMLIIMAISLFNLIMDMIKFILQHIKFIFFIGVITYLFSGIGGDILNQIRFTFTYEIQNFISNYVDYILDLF